ncbi:uncharacterized protein LOC134787530, partial [Penaeus indicus]|uniref:uncharacterized protein LOC134787530 n=1 Tax=Penaeus indicus TaxID=29960 RepID=UPI00300D6572
MSARILEILSLVAKGLNALSRIQGSQPEPARDNTQINEAMEIIRKQQKNIEQLMQDQRQQDQVTEKLLSLLEKMNENINGSSAMNSNNMQNMSLVLNFPEDSEDCSSIVHSLYWTLRNAMNHSQRSVMGGDPGRPLLQLTNDEDNMTRSDSFVQDSPRSFEQSSAAYSPTAPPFEASANRDGDEACCRKASVCCSSCIFFSFLFCIFLSIFLFTYVHISFCDLFLCVCVCECVR